MHSPQARDRARKLHFNLRQEEPIFRHPYEKYNSRISNDSFYRVTDTTIKSNPKDPQKRFQDKNIYICQTFLKENPFFGACYPGARRRSGTGEGTSGRGSERSRSFGTDFDESRTYRVFHSEESNCNEEEGGEDGSSPGKSKLKKSDDIHHFHEHHHFFHEKSGEKVEPRGKSRQSTSNQLIDSNISFLKKPIQESCMFYQRDEDGKKGRGPSRKSSKTGRKSSDNETYTVVCEYCQKLLRDYPNARIVGHENVPVRLSTQLGDRRPYIQYSYNGESMHKMNWMPANTFVSEPVQGPASRHTKSDDESSSSPAASPPREKVLRSTKDRENRRRIGDSNHKLILFKCDHCKSIIQFPYVVKVLKSSSSSTCSSEEVLRNVTARRSRVNRKASAMVNKSGDKSMESRSSVHLNTKKGLTPKVKSFSHKESRMSAIKEGSTELRDSNEMIRGEKKRNSGIVDKKSSGVRNARTSKRSLTTKGSIEVSLTSKDSPVNEKKSSKVTKKNSWGDENLQSEEEERNFDYGDKKTRKEVGVSSKRAVGTEVYMAKVEGKQKVIVTKERSMQTSSGRIDDPKMPKRSSTAAGQEKKRSETAPGSLLSSKATNTPKKGGSTVGKRTVVSASKEVPLLTVDPEGNAGLSGIQSEISELKTQLYRLEAMHNITETENHETIDCPKHPIVVCTSTTYIMTSYGGENDPKWIGNPKSQSKKKDSAAEFGLHVESTPPRPRREYVGQMKVLRKGDQGEQCLKGKYYDYLGKGTTLLSERMTKAVNRVCDCTNRDFLYRCSDGGKSCGEYRRLFANGKNQKRMWTGNGASTDDCCMKFTGNTEATHCRWHSVDFDRESVLEALRRNLTNRNDTIFAFRSCSAVVSGQVTRENTASDVTGKGVTVEDIRIDGNGYFLRTSVSDICEYRNGSLIRLTGKSGWVVFTKKLFLQKNNVVDEFLVYPAVTPKLVESRSAITIKGVEENPLEPEVSEDILADYDVRRNNPRQALSESSIYLPLTLREYNEGRTNLSRENGVSKTSVYLPRNVRQRNRGSADVRKHRKEMYLVNGRRGGRCGSEGDLECSCRQTGRKKRDAVPVLFEEMKTRARSEKECSDVSLKCVYAETLADKRTGSKVFWSSDWYDSKNRNKYVFAVSRSGRTHNNAEQYSMNDKHRKRKWHKYTSNRKNVEGNDRVRERTFNVDRRGEEEEVTPQGDSPVNPPNRCACCNCSPQHVCSAPNEKREEISGFRRLLKDVGLAGLNLNFFRRFQCDRVVHPEPVKVRMREDVRKTADVREYREEIRESFNSLKSAPVYGVKNCDCAKQIEDLLNRVELCRPPPPQARPPPPPPPPSPPEISQNEAWEEESEEEEESVNISPPPVKEDIKVEVETPAVTNFVDPEFLEEQRKRIEECENMLKQFEMKLEDVKRQNEAFACKCEEIQEKAPVQQQQETPPDVTQVMDHTEITTEEIVEEENIVTEKKEAEVEHVKKVNSCCSLPSKIELVCERKVCTCQECSNIHYIDKQYLPTSWMKKCKDKEPDKNIVKVESQTNKEEVKTESDNETLLYKSDLDKSSEDDLTEKSVVHSECDKNGVISCECTAKSKGDKCCNCDSKLKLIEDRLRALEKRKKTSETSSTKVESTKESSATEEVVEEPPPKEEKKETSEGETDVSSWENIESETDNEIKTKVITCNNLQFFVGGDPNIRTKCQCTEDSYCPFRYIQNETISQTKNIFFVTNIELLRQWSGLYAPNYKYCSVKRAAIKPGKVDRNWRNAVTSFFKTKIRRKSIFGRKKKEVEENWSYVPSTTSVDSFLNDCSRSSMPLKKRSFHILSEGPKPVRPGRVTERKKKRVER